MPNHCLDILCLDCGRRWCDRCGDRYGTFTEKELSERAVKNEGQVRAGFRKVPETLLDNCRCQCGSTRIAIE
jgi:transcriptional regulator NrdR family protein